MGFGSILVQILIYAIIITTGKQKRYSRLSGGCAIIITTGKKKVPVVCLGGCAVVSVFGSGRKLAVFLLWWESFTTTGKKKF